VFFWDFLFVLFVLWFLMLFYGILWWFNGVLWNLMGFYGMYPKW
jgi:hypothetical protein